MIVCICNNVSSKKIITIKSDYQNNGVSSINLQDLKKHMDICNQCGKCKKDIINILENEELKNIKK